MRLFKCDACGNVYEMLEEKSACTPVCCGQATRELVPGEVDAANEKHVPVISQEGNVLKVSVGSVDHPMLEAHFINAIWAEFEDGTLEKSGLVPGGKPEAVFDIKGRSGKVTVYEYCNLHGLWKSEFTIQ